MKVNSFRRRFEITGPSGSGKSFCSQKLSLNAEHIPWVRGFMGFFKLMFSNYDAFLFIFNKTIRSDRNFWHVLRVFFHVFAKVDTMFLACDKFPIVDEGISHIPFILNLSQQDLQKFVRLFSSHLTTLVIIFVYTPLELRRKHLLSRGHKRIRNVKDLNFILSQHENIFFLYYLEMLNIGCSVYVFNNSIQVDMDFG